MFRRATLSVLSLLLLVCFAQAEPEPQPEEDKTTSATAGSVDEWKAHYKAFAEQHKFTVGEDAIRSVRYLPAGDSLLVGDAGGGVRILDASTGEVTLEIANLEDELHQAEPSPDGKLIAGAFESGAVILWKVGDGSELKRLDHGSVPVFCLAWSPDGSQLATGSKDASLRVWNVEEATVDEETSFSIIDFSRDVPEESDVPIHHLAWAPAGDELLACGEEASVRKFRMPGLRMTTTFGFGSSKMRALAYSNSGDHEVRATHFESDNWSHSSVEINNRVETSREATAHSGSKPTCLDVARGDRFFALGQDDGTVTLYPLESKEPEKIDENSSVIHSVDSFHTIAGDGEPATCMDFHPTGAPLAVGFADGSVRILGADDRPAPLEQGEPVKGQVEPRFPWGPFEEQEAEDKPLLPEVKRWADYYESFEPLVECFVQGGVADAALSPSGEHIVTAGPGNMLRVLDASSGELVTELAGHEGDVNCVTFADTGEFLASGDNDGQIKLWRTETWTLRADLSGHSESVNAVSFSPDSRWLGSGSDDSSVIVWDVNTGRERSKHTASRFGRDGEVEEQANFTAVGFSDNSTTVIGGTDDESRYEWKVGSGSSHSSSWSSGGAKYIALGEIPGGSHFLSATDDGSISFNSNLRSLEGASAWISAELRDVVVNRYGKIAWAATPSSLKMLPLQFDEREETEDNDPFFGGSNGRLGVRKSFDTLFEDIVSLDFDWESSRLLVADGTGQIQVWGSHLPLPQDVGDIDAELEDVFPRKRPGVTTLKRTPDGALAVGFDDGCVRVRRPDGTPGVVFSGHEGGVTQLLYSNDGRNLFTLDSEGTVRLWDVATREVTRKLSCRVTDPRTFGVSPDGKYVVFADDQGSVKLWETALDREAVELLQDDNGIDDLLWREDGMFIAARSGTKVRVIDANSMKQAAEFELEQADDIAFRDGARELSVLGGNVLYTLSWGEQLKTGKVELELDDESDSGKRIQLSQDGGLVAIKVGDRTLHVFDTGDGSIAARVENATPISTFCFTEEERIAAGGQDGRVLLWKLPEREQ